MGSSPFLSDDNRGGVAHTPRRGGTARSTRGTTRCAALEKMGTHITLSISPSPGGV